MSEGSLRLRPGGTSLRSSRLDGPLPAGLGRVDRPGQVAGPQSWDSPFLLCHQQGLPGAVPSAVSSGAAGLGNATLGANPWAWRCVSCCSAHEVTGDKGDPPTGLGRRAPKDRPCAASGVTCSAGHPVVAGIGRHSLAHCPCLCPLWSQPQPWIPACVGFVPSALSQGRGGLGSHEAGGLLAAGPDFPQLWRPGARGAGGVGSGRALLLVPAGISLPGLQVAGVRGSLGPP